MASIDRPMSEWEAAYREYVQAAGSFRSINVDPKQDLNRVKAGAIDRAILLFKDQHPFASEGVATNLYNEKRSPARREVLPDIERIVQLVLALCREADDAFSFMMHSYAGALSLEDEIGKGQGESAAPIVRLYESVLGAPVLNDWSSRFSHKTDTIPFRYLNADVLQVLEWASGYVLLKQDLLQVIAASLSEDAEVLEALSQSVLDGALLGVSEQMTNIADREFEFAQRAVFALSASRDGELRLSARDLLQPIGEFERDVAEALRGSAEHFNT